MNVLVMTNTFSPHVGGVARSVERFRAEYRRRGHEVLVVAPSFPGQREEPGVVRVPALRNFNGSDFSLPVPAPGLLAADLDAFSPDIVHSHHPFLLGDTALRIAAQRAIPVVFTHHTLYERYTHYVPGDSPALQRAAIELAVGYCNLCDAVIAPSETIAELLRRRGVEVRIETIPTGVELDRYAAGDGAAFRQEHAIPRDAFVVGHVGRLAPEKNLDFLAVAVARFLVTRPDAHAVVAGAGPSRAEVERAFADAGVGERLHLAGVLGPDALAAAYRSMDVFAFASHTETQGMVLIEAMAAGVPVVAVDAPGVREVVADGENGRKLPSDDLGAFAEALAWVADLPPDRHERLLGMVTATARRFSIEATAEHALALYAELAGAGAAGRGEEADRSAWAAALRRLAEDWRIVRNLAHAAFVGGRPVADDVG